ncbi:MAG: hypothetical protein ACOZF0_20150 [Thermodesulfobacteriota bacterium]
MSIKLILETCNELKFKKIKKQKADYIELVFFAEHLPKWTETFTSLLGPPVKPAGKPPSGRDHRLTRELRGIRPDQTLYFNKIGDNPVLAMFWPWKDRLHITLKVSIPATSE